MSRRFWTALVSIPICALLLCFGVTSCSAPKAVFTSSYDLAGMLASNPRSIPEALERMDFKTIGPNANTWESEDLLTGPEQAGSASLSFDGLSAEDLSASHAPGRAELVFAGCPYADDRMVGVTTNHLMDRTGFEKPFYNVQTAAEQFDGTVRRLVGRIDEEKTPAAYWSIEIYQCTGTDASPRAYSDYHLAAWTEEAALASENTWMQEALANKNA